MKRRELRERDEAAGREQAERRLEDLLGKVREREAADRVRRGEPPADATSDQDGDATPSGDEPPA